MNTEPLLAATIAKRNNAALLASIKARSTIVYSKKPNTFEPGERQGKLTVIEKVSRGRYRVLCDCGKVEEMIGSDLSIMQSCGCGRGKRGKNGRYVKQAIKTEGA